jgi:hypothetical protein
MPAFPLPAASLSTTYRLPARRVRNLASTYLIYIVLWSIRPGILRAESIFSLLSGGGAADAAETRHHPATRDRRAFGAVFGGAFASLSAVTSTSTVMPRESEGKPVQVPEIGIAWRGSRATATRIRP